MAKTKMWANILCHEDMTPFLLVVTDGTNSTEIPVENCNVEFVKRTALDLFDLFTDHILVSQVFDGIEHGNGQ